MTWVPPLAWPSIARSSSSPAVRPTSSRVMAIPCVALFLALQRHYVQGFTTGALRG
jgi:ABC-type glycerol-3-phosphate transport system permease component